MNGPRLVFSLVCAILFATLGSARTITITAEECDEMAAINSLAPRLSWAMAQPSTGVFAATPNLQMHSKLGLLIRFPITDIVPKGQRITKAEMTITPNYLAGSAAHIHVRRVLAEWGTGVCHDYRMTYPKKVEWSQPGARGAGTDRAIKDSAVFKIAKIGAHTADVTEDVELWYTGAAPNRGWLMTLEKDGEHVYLPSPYAPYVQGAKSWKLQLTFEPQ